MNRPKMNRPGGRSSSPDWGGYRRKRCRTCELWVSLRTTLSKLSLRRRQRASCLHLLSSSRSGYCSRSVFAFSSQLLLACTRAEPCDRSCVHQCAALPLLASFCGKGCAAAAELRRCEETYSLWYPTLLEHEENRQDKAEPRGARREGERLRQHGLSLAGTELCEERTLADGRLALTPV